MAAILITSSLSNARPSTDVDLLCDAIAAYEANEYPAATQFLLPLARDGDPTAQLLLGKVLVSKSFVGRDCKDAVSWLSKAAAQHNREAEVSLAELFEYGDCLQQDHAIALQWYRSAYADGDGDAADAIARIYAGRPDSANKVKQVREWYIKGVEAFNSHSAFSLADSYWSDEGEGSRNADEAYMWFEVAHLIAPYFSETSVLAVRKRDRVREEMMPSQVEIGMKRAEEIVRRIAIGLPVRQDR